MSTCAQADAVFSSIDLALLHLVCDDSLKKSMFSTKLAAGIYLFMFSAPLTLLQVMPHLPFVLVVKEKYGNILLYIFTFTFSHLTKVTNEEQCKQKNKVHVFLRT